MIAGCFVKGFIPSRSGVAGLWTRTILHSPGMTKMPDPFLPSEAPIASLRPSNTEATCLRFSPVLPDRFARISDLDIGFAVAAFLATVLSLDQVTTNRFEPSGQEGREQQAGKSTAEPRKIAN